MKKHNFRKIDLFLLILIFFVALLFRLYKIDTPLADLHSWRQADTAAVARNYARNGIDLLHPKYDDLSSIESGLENPKGYRMVEFPIYNAIVAFIFRYLPIMPIEIIGRLTTVFFSLLVISIIYYLLYKESGRISAIIASSVYAVFPFFVFFSRVVLPETTALAFGFLSILFLYFTLTKSSSRWKDHLYYVLSLLTFAVSILIKPPMIFFSVTLFLIFWQKFKFSFLRKISFYLYFFLSVIPFALWRIYILKYPAGIPSSDWLITSVNTYQGLKNIFFRPAFFRWIFFERINNIILGGYLTFLLILGIFKKQSQLILHSILFSSLLYLFSFQGGNTQHEYYQTLILPALAIFVGLGTEFLYNLRKNLIPTFFAVLLIFVVFAFSFFFSFYRVRDYYNTPDDLTQIAKIVNTLTTPQEKIVTDTTGDTTLLYLMDRKGAPSLYKDPKVLGTLGYDYMVIFNQNYIKDLKKDGFVADFQNDKFTLFKL